jgi:hypothetical protein
MADVVAETRTVPAARARREAERRAPAPARPHAEPPPVRRSRKVLRYGLFALVTAVLIVGGLWYHFGGGRYVSRDDSYLQARACSQLSQMTAATR